MGDPQSVPVILETWKAAITLGTGRDSIYPLEISAQTSRDTTLPDVSRIMAR
jgi:hypothetical protein